MNKKIYLLLTVLLAWSFNLKAQTAQIESLTANPGASVSFDISVADIPATVGAVSLFIGYDPNVLTYTGSTLVDPDFTGYIINNMIGSNQVGIQWTDFDGAELDLVLLSLEFQYSNLGGSCNLTFGPGCEFANIDLTTIDVSYTGGSIGPNAGLPTVTIDELAAPPGPVSLDITGDGFAEEAGAITLYIEYGPELQFVDFSTTLNEALLFVNGNYAPGVIGVTYTNMDGDDLNTEFLTLNFNYDGTGETELVFLPGSQIANTVTDPIVASYDNGKVIPEATAYQMWIENKVTEPGNMIGIEVYANGFDIDYELGAVTLNIGFNPAHLSFVDITDGTIAGAYANLLGPGLIAISWSDQNTFIDGTMLTLNFDYHFGASPITFEGGCQVVDETLTFIPTTFTDGSISPVLGGPEVSLPTITGTIGQTIDFPITAKNFGLYEPGAVSMFVGYDNAVLTFTGFTEGILTGAFVNAMPGSQVGIQWVNIDGVPVADDDVLLTLSFTYNGGECALTFNGGCEFAETDFDIIPVSYYDGALITGTLFDITVLLEGPYNGAGMNTYLNSGGLLPLSQPYSGLPWSYAGTENVAAIPNVSIVDWVLLEIRETTGDVESATSATVVAQQAGFLLDDGSVVGLDGSSNILVPTSFNDNVYVVLYHRNHIRVMSSSALTQIGGVYTYDFTDAQAKAYDSQQKAIGSVYGMYAGDIDNDGEVFSYDLDLILIDYPSFGVYYNSDLDLDGEVFSGDLDIILFNYPLFTSIP